MPPDPFQIAQQYARRNHYDVTRRIGYGKDGNVYQSTRMTAVKVHTSQHAYENEFLAYLRLKENQVVDINGFRIPALEGFDDALLVIEIGIVQPPFLVDFASAYFDAPPDYIEDEGNTLEDRVHELFDERADIVMGVYYELARRTGIYLSDLHPHNIKFE